jgi:hypothetical protein
LFGACVGAPNDLDDENAAEASGSELARQDVLAADVNVTVVQPPVTQLVSDLRPDGVMRFYSHDAASLGVQINVTNIGNMAAWAPAGTVVLNGTAYDAALYQYYGGTATMQNTVNPGEHGYILVYVPNGALQPCSRYPVQIDSGRNMQAGLPDPYANDSATIATQCLSWTATINSNNFSISGPPTEGSSLARIVGSFDIGRTDGLRCSACHFETATARTYRPPVAQNASASIASDQVISGLSWAQPGGWADRFLLRPTDNSLGSKPYHLKLLVQAWIDDGRNPGNQLRFQVPLSGVFTRAN